MPYSPREMRAAARKSSLLGTSIPRGTPRQRDFALGRRVDLRDGLRELFDILKAEVGNRLRHAVLGDAKIRLLQIAHRLPRLVIDAHIHQNLIGLGVERIRLLRSLSPR